MPTMLLSCLQYVFTLTPVGGGPPIIVTSSNLSPDFNVLAPGTQVGCQGWCLAGCSGWYMTFASLARLPLP